MRPALFLLPFVSLLAIGIGLSLQNAMPQMPWLAYVSWACGAALFSLWVALEFENLKEFFTRKGAKYGASSGLSLSIGVIVIIMIGVLSNRDRFDKAFDVTSSRVNTLASQTLRVLEQVEASSPPVSIIGFFVDDQVEATFQELVSLYLLQAPNLKVEMVNAKVEHRRALQEKVTHGNTVIVRRGNQENRLTTFNEERLTNALLNVLKDQAKQILFVRGHGEGGVDSEDMNGFSIFAQELRNNRYDVGEITLTETGGIPSDTELLVIAGPKYELHEQEVNLIDDYLMQGGALLVMLDAVTPVNRMNQFLHSYGVQFDHNLLILRPDDPRAQMFGENMSFISEFDEFHPLTRDFAGQSNVVLMAPNSRSISVVADNKHGMKVESVGKANPLILEVTGIERESDLANEIGADRLQEGEFSLVVVATGRTKAGINIAKAEGEGREQQTDVTSNGERGEEREIRLIAMGSSQIANNYGAQRAENLDMAVNAANYLLRDEGFISIRPRERRDSTLQMASAGSQFLLLFLAFIYPFVFLGVGVWFWAQRRAA